jgi:hypothetical protein
MNTWLSVCPACGRTSQHQVYGRDVIDRASDDPQQLPDEQLPDVKVAGLATVERCRCPLCGLCYMRIWRVSDEVARGGSMYFADPPANIPV